MENKEINKSYVIDVEIEGTRYEVYFERFSELEFDGMYGADYDGRRGTGAWFLVQDKYENVSIDDKPLDFYSKDLQNKIGCAIEDYCNEHVEVE